MDATAGWALAQRWCDAWNGKDIDAIMALYADDVSFNSPSVVTRWNIPDGWIRSKDRLRANFEKGLQTPGMHFEVTNVLTGLHSVAILYARETGALALDLVELDEDGLICRVVACYGQAR
ncbi:MAG: nuclear transport factor 2 family protein [Alphaproteobacteria bacterium]